MKGSSQGYFAKTKSYDTISLWPSWSCVAMFDHRHLSMTGEAMAWGHRKWPEQRLKNCLWESKIAIENGNLWKFICTWVNFHGYVEQWLQVWDTQRESTPFIWIISWKSTALCLKSEEEGHECVREKMYFSNSYSFIIILHYQNSLFWGWCSPMFRSAIRQSQRRTNIAVPGFKGDWDPPHEVEVFYTGKSSKKWMFQWGSFLGKLCLMTPKATEGYR